MGQTLIINVNITFLVYFLCKENNFLKGKFLPKVDTNNTKGKHIHIKCYFYATKV